MNLGADDALKTLELMRDGVYNLERPSKDIIRELVQVILLLDKQFAAGDKSSQEKT